MTIERIKYLNKNDPETAAHLERYRFALKYISNNSNVCDIACGLGFGTKLISKYSKFVTGVDIDEYSVEYANKQNKTDNIKFITGQGTKLPFKDNSFDIITSFETIEHIEDYDYFLSELRRILKKGGMLIMSTPNWENEKNYHLMNIM